MQYIDHKELAKNGQVEPVTKDNLERVKDEAREMIRLCFKRHGKHPSAQAIAHPQVSAKPLTFFVTATGNVYINPTVVARSGTVALRKEGCMSFPHSEPTIVPRHYQVRVRYQTPESVLEDEWYEQDYKDVQGQVMQHEIDHLYGLSPYSYTEEMVAAYKDNDYEKVLLLSL